MLFFINFRKCLILFNYQIIDEKQQLNGEAEGWIATKTESETSYLSEGRKLEELRDILGIVQSLYFYFYYYYFFLHVCRCFSFKL